MRPLLSLFFVWCIHAASLPATLAVCGDGIVDPGEECDDEDSLDNDECSNDCRLPDIPILYDQTDYASSENGLFDQRVEDIYSAYDSQAADDFVVTSPAGWDVDTVVTLGKQVPIGSAPTVLQHVHLSFHADLGGIPADSPDCDRPGLVDFDEEHGDLVVRLSQPCHLPSGQWWLVQQVRQDLFVPGGGFHYWSARTQQSQHPAVWRNPVDFFGTGCVDWTPATLCEYYTDPDVRFQLRGQPTASEPVPAVGPLGAFLLLLALGSGGSYLLSRRPG